MPTLDPKDTKLIDELTKATRSGRIKWSPTAKSDEFTASFRGKFSVVVSEIEPPLPGIMEMATGPLYPPREPSPARFRLRLLDVAGRLLLDIEDPSIGTLLESVRRYALQTDKALDEILEDLRS